MNLSGFGDFFYRWTYCIQLLFLQNPTLQSTALLVFESLHYDQGHFSPNRTIEGLHQDQVSKPRESLSLESWPDPKITGFGWVSLD